MAEAYYARIVADTADFQAKIALASAEARKFQTELTKAAREAANAGGAISTELRAKIDAAAQGFAAARVKVTDYTADMKALRPAAVEGGNALEFAKRGAEAFGLALTIEKVAEFTKSLIENAAHIEHESLVLQMTSTEFQVMQQAAIDSGLELDVMEGAMKRLSKSASEAAVGNGKAAGAFVEMGINASQGKLALMEQISTWMMHQDAVTRDRISTELFSRTGAEMIPIYEKLNEENGNLTEKYKEQGRILDGSVTKGMENAEIQARKLGQRINTFATVELSKGVIWLKDFTKEILAASAASEELANGSLLMATGMTQKIPPAKHTVAAEHKDDANKVIPLQQQIASLDQLDNKLLLRKELTTAIARAETVLAAATAAGDRAGIAKANEVIADKQKELDALNKKPNTSGFGNIGDRMISDAKAANAAITADANLSLKERFDLEQANLQKLLDSHKLNAKQINDVNIQMSRDQVAYQREVVAQNRAVDINNLQTQLELARQNYEQQKATLDQEVAEHKITRDQEVVILTAALRDQERLQLEAVDLAAKGYEKDLLAWTKFQNEKRIIAGQTLSAISQLSAKGAIDDERTYSRMERTIEQSESSLVRNIVGGRMTAAQMIQQLASETLEHLIEDNLKELTHHVFITNAKAAATAAGAEAEVAAKSAARAQGSAADLAAGSAEIGNDALQAAAGAYKAVVGIPIVGPVLAPIAAGTAFAGVMAFDTLTSFDVGTNYVPRDMTAKIHEGERVIPRADNRALMEALNTGSGSGNRQRLSEQHMHVNINAVDAPSVERLFKNNGRALVKSLHEQIKLNNTAWAQGL